MKKFLSAVLASAMALSMASVAFAKETVDVKVDLGHDTKGYFDNSIVLAEAKDVNDPDVINKLKVSYDIDMGEEWVDEIKWVAKKDGVNASHYQLKLYFVEAPKHVDAEDVIGTVTLEGKSNYVINGNDEITFDFGVEVKNDAAQKMNTIYDDVYVYNFKDIEDEEYEISLFAESGRFVVDTRGQGKVTIKSTVKYSKGIEAITPDVAYTYYNGNGVKFNKMGTLYLNANETDVLYAMNGDKLEKLNAKYDADEEAFVIRTREIGSYVVAEKEIVLEEAVAPETVVPSNPSTGAAC